MENYEDIVTLLRLGLNIAVLFSCPLQRCLEEIAYRIFFVTFMHLFLVQE